MRTRTRMPIATARRSFSGSGEKWNRLLHAAEASIGSPSYALDLITFNASTEPVIGSPTRMGRAEFSIDKILDASPVAGQDTIELRHQLEMQQRGDMSALVACLSMEVPIWSQLPDPARAALIEGERRISERAAHDHAPDIVSFAKAVEISRRRSVDRFARAAAVRSRSEEARAGRPPGHFKQTIGSVHSSREVSTLNWGR